MPLTHRLSPDLRRLAQEAVRPEQDGRDGQVLEKLAAEALRAADELDRLSVHDPWCMSATPERVSPETWALLLRRVDTLGLSVRATNCLVNNSGVSVIGGRVQLVPDEIVYVGDLIQRSPSELLRIPNFGRVSLKEVEEKLASFGLHLAMGVPSWPSRDVCDQLASGVKS